MYPPLSVFIPTYNCGHYIEHTIHQTYAFLQQNFEEFELIIVDDNSKDNTWQIASDLQQQYPQLSVLRNDNGPTKRENLGKAMMSAKFDIVLYQDQDLSVPLHYILKLVDNLIHSTAAISIGSRYSGIAPKRSISRLLASRLFNLSLKLLFNSKINDHICGFKAFKKDSLVTLLQAMGYDQTKQRGWFWDAELLIRAQSINIAINEIPVEWVAANDSTVKLYREIGMVDYIRKFYKTM